MIRCTAEERALARAALYRLLALSFSYPTRETFEALSPALEVATVAAALTDDRVAERVAALRSALQGTTQSALEPAYQHVFTLSYSEDCPPYETAFSASHIFQQTAQQGDLAGFYRAFGVDPQGERPDHVATELEFAYLLALKEAHARREGDGEHVRVVRDAERLFQKRHLARWGALIGQRIALRADGSAYGAAGRLLIVFLDWEERFLRLRGIERYRDEPVMIADDPGEMSCPFDDVNLSPEIVPLQLFDTKEEGEHVLAGSS